MVAAELLVRGNIEDMECCSQLSTCVVDKSMTYLCKESARNELRSEREAMDWRPKRDAGDVHCTYLYEIGIVKPFLYSFPTVQKQIKINPSLKFHNAKNETRVRHRW